MSCPMMNTVLKSAHLSKAVVTMRRLASSSVALPAFSNADRRRVIRRRLLSLERKFSWATLTTVVYATGMSLPERWVATETFLCSWELRLQVSRQIPQYPLLFSVPHIFVKEVISIQDKMCEFTYSGVESSGKLRECRVQQFLYSLPHSRFSKQWQWEREQFVFEIFFQFLIWLHGDVNYLEKCKWIYLCSLVAHFDKAASKS